MRTSKRLNTKLTILCLFSVAALCISLLSTEFAFSRESLVTLDGSNSIGDHKLSNTGVSSLNTSKEPRTNVTVLRGYRKNAIVQGAGSLELRTIESGGRVREFYLYKPSIANSHSYPLPMVIACHGGGGNARSMDKLTGGLTKLADREHFLVAFPQGLNKHWNDGRQVNDSETSDVEFIGSLIDTMVDLGLANKNRVYSTGISNGGFFSLYLAKMIPEKLAAVASVAATLPEIYLNLQTSPPMPVLYILGTEDPLVPYMGGQVGGKLLRKKRGKVVSADHAIQYWLKNNGIESSASKKETKLDAKTDQGLQISVAQYSNGEACRDVTLYKIAGGGHTWPQGWQYLPVWLVGKTSSELNANEAIWRFFGDHPKSARQ